MEALNRRNMTLDEPPPTSFIDHSKLTIESTLTIPQDFPKKSRFAVGHPGFVPSDARNRQNLPGDRRVFPHTPLFTRPAIRLTRHRSGDTFSSARTISSVG